LRRLVQLLPVTLAVLASGCGDEPPIIEPVPEPQPAFLDAVVEASPANGLSLEVLVRAVLYDSAFVRYWGTGDTVFLRTPDVPFGPDSTSRVPVVGLMAGGAYRLEVNLARAGQVAAVDTLSFQAGPLPAWVPAAAVQGSDTTPGFLAVSYPQGVAILDNLGRVVWYRENPSGVLNSFQAHPDGRYTSFRLGDSISDFRVLDVLGRETGTMGCVGRPTRFHDLRVERAGDYWIMCDDSLTMDLSALGGVDGANVIWTVLQHVSPDRQVLFEWRSWEHVEITDVPANERGGARVNATHGNGIELDADGHLLLSFRSLNQVLKVDRSTGEVIWRLGGVRNDFTFVNDSLGGFLQQHGLRRAGPGFLQLLDNRAQAPSRFVRYLVNPVARTATLVVDFRDSPTTFTSVGGSTEYYGNGHAVVTFGRAGRVVEIDEFGNRAWELTGIDNTYVFRVQRIPSLYGMGRTSAPDAP
jgi:hypothetical protein